MFDSRSYSQKSAHSCSRVIGEYSSCGHLESPVALASQYIGWAGIIEDLSVSCDFHPKWKVMSRRLIEMHSVFREQEVSIESRNIIISLWPRVSSRKDCAFKWLWHRLYVIVRAERQVKKINGITSHIDRFSHSVGTFCAFRLQRL